MNKNRFKKKCLIEKYLIKQHFIKQYFKTFIIALAVINVLSPAHMMYGNDGSAYDAVNIAGEIGITEDVNLPDSGLLWVVNAENLLNEDYVPSGMVRSSGFQMRSEVAGPFEKMTAAMEADGVSPPHVQSAYRDYRHQRHLFAQKKIFYKAKGLGEPEAEANASRTVAVPGASEHQSGLALDVTLDGMLQQTFGETEQGKWLSEHSHEYGFIIRYPQDKTNVTRIIYEPWHLRYVGMPHASLMKEKNLCLEEYIAYLAANGRVVFWNEDGSHYLIFYGSKLDKTDDYSNLTSVSSCKAAGGHDFIFTVLKSAHRVIQ